MGLALIGFNYRGITRIQGGTNTWHEGASRPGAAKQPAAGGYRRWCAQALLYKIHSAIIFVQSLPRQTGAGLRSLALTLSTTFYYICLIFNLDVTLCTLPPRMQCTMNPKYEVLIQTKTLIINHISLQVPMGET